MLSRAPVEQAFAVCRQAWQPASRIAFGANRISQHANRTKKNGTGESGKRQGPVNMPQGYEAAYPTRRNSNGRCEKMNSPLRGRNPAWQQVKKEGHSPTPE